MPSNNSSRYSSLKMISSPSPTFPAKPNRFVPPAAFAVPFHITVEAKRKAVDILNWGGPPFARDEHGNVLPHEFTVRTYYKANWFVASIRVVENPLEPTRAEYRFESGDKVGQWNPTSSGALQSVVELLGSAIHCPRGSNGALQIGVTYENVQRAVRTVFRKFLIANDEPLFVPSPSSTTVVAVANKSGRKREMEEVIATVTPPQVKLRKTFSPTVKIEPKIEPRKETSRISPPPSSTTNTNNIMVVKPEEVKTSDASAPQMSLDDNNNTPSQFVGIEPLPVDLSEFYHFQSNSNSSTRCIEEVPALDELMDLSYFDQHEYDALLNEESFTDLVSTLQ